MNAIELIWERARKHPQHVVLPEGLDSRTVKAAEKIVREGLGKVTVLGPRDKVAALCREQGVKTDGFAIEDPARSPLLEEFIATYVEMRKGKKPVTPDEARQVLLEDIAFGAMMEHTGRLDCFVSGAIHATADICRAVFRIVGTSRDVKIASSFSLMQLPTEEFGCHGALIYADTGAAIDPNAEELADISVASARTAWALLDTRPKIAMISFSTKGSAKHPVLDKIIKATELAAKRMREIGMEADIDGELQADAALIPAICAKKAPGSPVAGQANVLVFPDLNVGNTCYKLTERLAHASAYGPVFQGLKKPASDLSRGCSADDIVGIAAIIACQAMAQKT